MADLWVAQFDQMADLQVGHLSDWSQKKTQSTIF